MISKLRPTAVLPRQRLSSPAGASRFWREAIEARQMLPMA
jgi:hypothetical protein